MKKLFFNFISTLFSLVILTLVSCNKEVNGPNDSGVKEPILITSPVTEITKNSASCGGTITSNGGDSITSRGICWSNVENPTIALNTKTSDGAGTGSFTCSLSGLSPNTLYYVRAYATNSAGTAYGNQLSFKTAAINPPSIETVLIPGGEFTMGSPISEPERNSSDETQYQVLLSAFRMSKYEITNQLFATFLNENGIGEDGKLPGGLYPNETLIAQEVYWGVIWTGSNWAPVSGKENYPVVNVTWFGAAQFAAYAGGRLPTEAEWEYACRAGSIQAFSTGDCLPYTNANYKWSNPLAGGCTNDNTNSPNQPLAVNSYSANNFGLFNMHGNVAEWCNNWYSRALLSGLQVNPTRPATGQGRVIRGGAYNLPASWCRSAIRDEITPNYLNIDLGFRLVFAP